MGLLNSAIEAELHGKYRRAIGRYKQLARQGSMLDRVGIYQAIARCFEKLGSLRKAGYWHERAGEGYLKVPSRLMGPQERAYYAMVEFRGAIQDYAPNPSLRAAHNYLRALQVCLKAGKEGYSHEMLFAANLCAKIHEFKRAAELFDDAATLFEKEKQGGLAHESYLLGAEYYEKSGNARLGRKLRATANALR
jgi:tetratricopeptide (TPR) repeat protein